MPKYGQPVISRETRLLLITIVVSVVCAVAARAAPFPGSAGERCIRRACYCTTAAPIELRRSRAIAVEPRTGRVSCDRRRRSVACLPSESAMRLVSASRILASSSCDYPKRTSRR